jgi:hypothetical protein
MTTPICSTCEYCRHWKAQAIQGTKADKSGKGYCAAHPPQISDYQTAKFFGEGLRGCELSLKVSWWPATEKADGCGEFTQREV